MKNLHVIILVFIFSIQLYAQHAGKTTTAANAAPSLLKGHFTDDYGDRYSINDTLWTQLPNINYHIISWDTTAQFVLAKNDNNNPSEAGLYTRIDYMYFNNMLPYRWGFCLTVYNAATIDEAKTKAKADRQNPKKGCNGYPFSRMKNTE